MLHAVIGQEQKWPFLLPLFNHVTDVDACAVEVSRNSFQFLIIGVEITGCRIDILMETRFSLLLIKPLYEAVAIMRE